MNIISWNVRGLGRPSKRFLVKDFLLLHHVDIVCLQESKLSLIGPATWRSIGGPKLDKFAFTPACGSAGAMIIGWNSNLVEGLLLSQGTFCLSVKFRTKSDDTKWICTSVYGPNARHLKADFWNEIRSCCP
ncbi:DNase I-like protein [Dioscorea alata]|uniref:DNase I-like protein n=1 Tax=Dioscorea alata TaxID=55571 RepID=A0ACB7W4L4_DIOAL|nr:DNase I-like protein [Dioscorea alata]